jgi:hypothetical protein
MIYTDRRIVESYSTLFEGLNATSKLELIERLSISLKKEKYKKDTDFFQSFGALKSDKSADEMVAEIKASRKFRQKEIKF